MEKDNNNNSIWGKPNSITNKWNTKEILRYTISYTNLYHFKENQIFYFLIQLTKANKFNQNHLYIFHVLFLKSYMANRPKLNVRKRLKAIQKICKLFFHFWSFCKESKWVVFSIVYFTLATFHMCSEAFEVSPNHQD